MLLYLFLTLMTSLMLYLQIFVCNVLILKKNKGKKMIKKLIIMIILSGLLILSCNKVEKSMDLSSKGLNALEESKADRAEKLFTKSLKLDEHNLDALKGLLIIAKKNDDKDEMKRLIEKILIIAPDDSYALREKAVLLLEDKKIEEAYETLSLCKLKSCEDMKDLLVLQMIKKQTEKDVNTIDVKKLFDLFLTKHKNKTSKAVEACALFDMMLFYQRSTQINAEQKYNFQNFIKNKMDEIYIQVDKNSVNYLTKGFELSVSFGHQKFDDSEAMNKEFEHLIAYIYGVAAQEGTPIDPHDDINNLQTRERLFFYEALTVKYKSIFKS